MGYGWQVPFHQSWDLTVLTAMIILLYLILPLLNFQGIGQYSNSLTPMPNLQWLLFDGLSVSMNKRKLELLEEYSMGYSTIVVENTIQSIILGYYLALLEEERLKVLESVKGLSGDRYNYEMMRKEIG